MLLLWLYVCFFWLGAKVECILLLIGPISLNILANRLELIKYYHNCATFKHITLLQNPRVYIVPHWGLIHNKLCVFGNPLCFHGSLMCRNSHILVTLLPMTSSPAMSFMKSFEVGCVMRLSVREPWLYKNSNNEATACEANKIIIRE